MKKWNSKCATKKVIFLLLSFSLFTYKVQAETILDCSDNKCNYEVSIKNASNYQYYNTLKEAINEITSSENTTIYLVKDIEIDSVIDINPGLNITINGQDKYIIKRKSSSDYTGTFFNLLAASTEQQSKLSLKNLTIDAGANIEINKTAIKAIKDTTPSVATSVLETDYFNISPDSKSTSSNLLTIGSYTSLILYNSNIQNFHSTDAIMLSVASNGNLLLKDSNIQNNYLSNSSRLTSLTGTLRLEDNSSINNNYVISNGGIAFGEISNGTLAINDSSSIRDNIIINATNVFRIKNAGNVFINEDMKDGNYKENGAKISNNISYPGPNTSLSTLFYNYNSNSGSFIMHGGEITNNTGGNYVIMDQRRPLDILKWEAGIIKNNKSVYDKGIIISMRGSDVGKNMIIEDSAYIRLGGTDDFHYFNNEGIMNGNILISQLSGTFKNMGVITGNVTVDNAYSSTPTTFTGTINGTMTFQNNANGLITGTINNDVYINSNSKLEITGVVNGNIYVDMTNNTNEQPLSGTGTINGYIIYKYDSNSSLSTEHNQLNINGNVIKYNPQNEVLITIYYNGEKDKKGNEYSIISVPIDSTVDLSNIEFSNTKKDFDNWYKDKSLTTKWNYKATENAIIYAKWVGGSENLNEEKIENPFTFDEITMLSISLLIILTSLILVLLYLRKKSKGNVYYT